MRSFALLAAAFVLLTIALGYVTGVPVETGVRLAVGWLAFLARTLSRVTVNWSGVATIALCGALLLVGGHRFAAWLSSAWGARSPSASPAETPAFSAAGTGSRGVRVWPLRRTALMLAIVVLMFVAGISSMGLVHQTAWLATTPEAMTEYRLNLRDTRRYHINNLWSVGSAFYNWGDVFRRPPMNGGWPEGQQDGMHSWQTRILGFLPVSAEHIDFKLDWDDPKNAPAFRRFVPAYLTPEFGVLRESRGYAVSHYAGNVHFFEPQPPSMATLKKRGRSMIVCGEVADNFMAWGDPANLRDPARGINRSRDGFGSADERGALFLMADGSTRFLATDIDPSVLAAVASPEASDAELPDHR
jgi:hypothetical protein